MSFSYRLRPSLRPALVVVLALTSLIILGGCGLSKTSSAASPTIVRVTFASTMTYAQAVRTVSDFGLRLTLPCRNEVATSNVSSGTWIRWISVDQSQNYGRPTRSLWITTTVLAPSDWQVHLRAASGVSRIDTAGTNISCNVHIADPSPAPGTPYYLPAAGSDTYAQVRFRANTLAYDSAIGMLENLGLRVAAPCLERALRSGKHITWQPVGEESQFSSSHTIVVATTEDAANTWQAQVAAILGVMAVQRLSGDALTC